MQAAWLLHLQRFISVPECCPGACVSRKDAKTQRENSGIFRKIPIRLLGYCIRSVPSASISGPPPASFHQRRLAVPIQRSLINGKKSGAPDLCLVILHPQKFRQSHFLGAFRAQENLIEHDASRQASIPLKMVVMTVGRSESNVVHENVATVLDPLR